jgi:hypothetical protein
MRAAVGPAVCGGTVLLFWLAYCADLHFGGVWRAEYAAMTFRRPPLVNGLKLTLDAYLQPPIPQQQHRRYLVFVTADSCAVCRAELPVWQAFLENVRLTTSDAVILVSFNGNEIPGALATAVRERTPAPVFSTAVSNSAGFMAQTGIAAMPEILGLDSDRRIRISSETLSPIVERQLYAWLDGR